MKKILSILISCTMLFSAAIADEGMYPISEIHKLDLKAAGLEMHVQDLYNPDGISLIDGIVNISGCTGSFVSSDGLIITNHHCAYRAINNASTASHDYLQEGFITHNKSEEIPAKGYVVRITESYKDVSGDVLSVVKKSMTNAQRTQAIDKKMKAIVAKAEKLYPGKRAAVSEMFPGKTYVLFIYTNLRDIRLVYAPPRSIGNFGGDVDNWMWPRHTGDFSFMRAYVGPDGKSAAYSEDNIPYTPKRVLKVQPKGVSEEDFVFILGYPGRTYRNQTSHYIDSQEKIRMPWIVDYYQWQIKVMEEIGKDDRNIALKHLSRMKGLANTEKNYRGKILGLGRLKLADQRRSEEADLQKFIDADSERKEKYGNLLKEIGEIYAEQNNTAERSLILGYFRRSSTMLNIASTIYEASIELSKKDIDRKSAYMDRNWRRTRQRLIMGLDNYYEKTDKILFKDMLTKSESLPADQRFNPHNPNPGSMDNKIEKMYAQSKLADKNFTTQLLDDPVQNLKDYNGPFINMAKALYGTFKAQKEIRDEVKGRLDKLFALLLDAKREYKGDTFLPDANGTLRFTYGRIRGYSPKDAVYMSPLTTVEGVLQKTTGKEPFDPPQKILDLIKNKDYGQFAEPFLGSVPTAMLYNMDTTGGNSGSPIFNAKGELVGVNFDRAFEATINDYAWSESYSRSIGVDIRYVLWIVEKFGGATGLLEEMGVK
ncbi:S46 family peptidase [bacterium]|nr:S46 family peptidase [bacterium]